MFENPFRVLMKNLGKILVDPELDIESLVSYGGVVIENIIKMIEVFELMNSFIDSRGAIHEEDLFKSDSIFGGGDYYKKYKKYKNKLRNL